MRQSHTLAYRGLGEQRVNLAVPVHPDERRAKRVAVKDRVLRAEIRRCVKISPIKFAGIRGSFFVRREEQHILVARRERVQRDYPRALAPTDRGELSQIGLLKLGEAVHEYLYIPETELQTALHRVERLVRIKAGRRDTDIRINHFLPPSPEPGSEPAPGSSFSSACAGAFSYAARTLSRSGRQP